LPFELATITYIRQSSIRPESDRLKITLVNGSEVYFKQVEESDPDSVPFLLWVDWDLTDRSLLEHWSEAAHRQWIEQGGITNPEQLKRHILDAGPYIRCDLIDAGSPLIGEPLYARIWLGTREMVIPLVSNIAKIEPTTVEEVLAKREQPQGFESWPDISA